MIVTQGKIIKVRLRDFHFERSSETPGAVVVTSLVTGRDEHVTLPTDQATVEQFIAAYRRIVNEDIGYREQAYE